jgi:transposase-like protein
MTDWRDLAEQGSKETDPHNLMGVLEELDRVLDEERQSDDASEIATIELAKRVPKVRKSLLPHFRNKLGEWGAG